MGDCLALPMHARQGATHVVGLAATLRTRHARMNTFGCAHGCYAHLASRAHVRAVACLLWAGCQSQPPCNHGACHQLQLADHTLGQACQRGYLATANGNHLGDMTKATQAQGDTPTTNCLQLPGPPSVWHVATRRQLSPPILSSACHTSSRPS